MTSPEEALVTANGWIKGISFSILASIIGAASKLSIRKSWLIDAKRKEQRLHQLPSTDTNNSSRLNAREAPDYGDIYSPTNRDTNLAPLEVGSPAHLSSHPQESFSCEEENESSNNCGYFSNTNKQLKILSPKNISWLLYLSGMIGMTFLNPLCCVLAMRYANPSILAPFSGLTLVWVVVFSRTALGENPGMSQKVACALIVVGEVLVATFGDHTNGEEKGVDDVISSYHEPAFQTFILFMTLFFVQLGICVWMFPNNYLLRKVAWGSIGGSITGFQNFLKDSLTILSATSNTSNPQQSLPALFYVFSAFAMLTAFVGLLCLAACMKRYDATYSAAMFVVSFVLSASLMSSVHYHTLDHLEGVTNYIMYPMGLLTLFFGAFILVKPNAISASCLFDNNCNDDISDEGQSSYLGLDNAASPGKESNHRERLLMDGG